MRHQPRNPGDPDKPQFLFRRSDPSLGEWTFRQLLGPISVDTFLTDYWGKNPFVVRGDSTLYDSLITLDQVEALLGIPHVLEDRMVSLRSKGDQLSSTPDSVGHIYRRLGECASLQFRKMERFLPPAAPLAKLYRDMQLSIQHPGVSISCFLTPSNAELLGAHHDETDIFTLQISGRKRWRFHDRILSEGRGHYDGPLDRPVADIVLGPGDLLYHPRGQVHEVTCEDELSFSIPIVFGSFTWSELLHQLIDRLADRPEFLEALPAGVLLSDDAGAILTEGIAARAALIVAETAQLDPDDLASTGARRLLEGLGAERGSHISDMLALAAIDPSTLLLPRYGRAYKVSVHGDRAMLVLGGGDALKVPANVAPALRAIMKRRSPAAASALHDSLSASSSLILARNLLALGALSPVAIDGPEEA